jgi:tRNA (guanine-N7-)-methyltransferase
MDTELHQARTFFGRRKGHKLRNRQAELLATLLPRLALDIARPAPVNLAELFALPVSEIELEIGFGGGENLVAQAAARPTHGFIGIEPFVNGMAKALSAIESADLKNIRLHFDEAGDLIRWLPDASLARIELIHPDPWPKRRHWKRRFVQDASVAQFARLLRRDGEVRFVTDVPDYAAWTLQRFLRSPDFEWTVRCADDGRQPWPEFRGTRYHAKAARQQRGPCFLIFRRR